MRPIRVEARARIASPLTEKAFADRRRGDWEELDELVRRAEPRGAKRLDPHEAARFAPLYRSVCSDLAAAEAARYSAMLVEYLRGLTASAHGVLYTAATTKTPQSVRRAWLVAFPLAIRRRPRATLVAAALFFVPLVIGLLLSIRDPTFAFRVAPEATLRPLAEAYAKGFDGARSSGTSSFMAGFYVYNNVSIALRCFALGVFAGVGSAFYLFQNGLTIGAILGYVTAKGAGVNVLLFIIGHGSLELGAIVLSGGAGLSLGWSLVAPGDKTRIDSMRHAARDVMIIVAGAVVMLLFAAFLEAFWSASSAPPAVKVGVGGALLVLVVAYALLGGRDSS